MYRQEEPDVNGLYCTSSDNKKPAKPYDLRVLIVLCTALNQCLVRWPVS